METHRSSLRFVLTVARPSIELTWGLLQPLDQAVLAQIGFLGRPRYHLCGPRIPPAQRTRGKWRCSPSWKGENAHPGGLVEASSSPSGGHARNARRQAIAPGPPAPGRPPVNLVSAAFASPASIPATANTFVRERSPRCSDTRLGVTPRALASARRASSVAAPPTGAAATRITRLRAAISHPGRERGRTRTSTSTPPGIARTTSCLRKVGSLGCQSHLPEQGASTQLLRPLHCLMPIPSPSSSTRDHPTPRTDPMRCPMKSL
jgi:hypothetical protein